MDAPLTPAFALILLDRQKTDNASLSFGVKPNCVILSIFFELFINGIFDITHKNQVMVKRPGINLPDYQNAIYKRVSASIRPRSLQHWINSFHNSAASSSAVTEIMDSVIGDLRKRALLSVNENQVYVADAGFVSNKISTIKKELTTNGPVTDHVLVLAALMMRCHILKLYYSVPEKKQIKNRIRGIWQDRIFDRSEVMSTAMDYDSLQVILGAIFTVLE